MTPDQAADLVARIQDEIACPGCDDPECRGCADRERVTSDLAGLRAHHRTEGRRASCSCGWTPWQGCDDGRRYEAGLRRTAALYGVTP